MTMDLREATGAQLYRVLVRLLRRPPPTHLLPFLIYTLASPLLPTSLLSDPLPTTWETPLVLCCRYGLLQAVGVLLERGIDGWVDKEEGQGEGVSGAREVCRREVVRAALGKRKGVAYTLRESY